MNYLLKYIVPTLLGDYIHGIDYDSIKTSYFSGEISLENISLKKDIFIKKGIPLSIVYSVIGKLELKIPWLKVRKEPLVATLRDMYIVIALSNPKQIDPVRQRAVLMNEISKACYEKIGSNDAQGENKKNISAMKINIIDNIQVSLKNIHIRFEDQEQNTILGFVLDEFSANTTNENWEKEFLDRTLEVNKFKNLCRKAEISNLLAYCLIEKENSKFLTNASFTDDYRRNYLKISLQNYLSHKPTTAKESPDASSIIFKMSAELKMVMKSKNIDSFDEPKIFIHLFVKQQDAMLHHSQIEHLLITSEKIANLGKMIEHHPPELVGEEKITKQKEFEYWVRKYLEAKKGEEVDWIAFYDEDKTEVGHGIRKYLIIVSDEMINAALNEVIPEVWKKFIERSKKKKSSVSGFFKKKESAITKEEEHKADEFIQQIIQKNQEELKILSDGFIYKIHVQIESGFLFLVNEGKNQTSAGVSFEMEGFECVIESRKFGDQQQQLLTEASFRQVLVFLKSKRADSDYYKQFNIMKRRGEEKANKDVQVSVFRKTDGQIDQIAFKVRVQELVVNYLASFFYQLMEFTTFKNRLHTLEHLANEEMDTLATQASNNLKDLVQAEKKLEFFVDILFASPRIVVPLQQNGDLTSDMWLFSLGDISILTPEKMPHDVNVDRALQLGLSGLSLQYYPRWQNWIEQQWEAQHVNLLEEIKTECFIYFMKTNLQQSSKLPAIRLKCELSSVSLHMDKLLLTKVQQLAKCLDFTQESEFQELLECRKAQIMKNQPKLFNLLYGEQKDVLCVGLFYEYHLYIYKNAADLMAMKIIRLVDQNPEIKPIDDFYTIELLERLGERVYLTLAERVEFEEFSALMKESIALGRKMLGEHKQKIALAKQEITHEETVIQKLPTTKGSSALENKLSFEAQIEIPSVELELKTQQSKFNAKLGKIELRNASKTLQSDLSFSIDSFEVNVSKNKLFQTIVSSEALKESKMRYSEQHNTQLFRFSFTTYLPEHPTSRDSGCNGHIEVVFNSLFVAWKPILISELLYTVTDTLDGSGGDSNAQKIQVSINDEKNNELINHKKAKELAKALQSETPLEFTSMNITIVGLFISLYTPKTEIEMTSISLRNLSFGLDSSIEKSQIKGSLENLIVADLTDYPYTISDNKELSNMNELFSADKSEKSILEFNLILYPDYHPHLVDRKSMVARIELNSIVVNYMQQPVLRIIDYATNYFLNIDLTQLMAPDNRTLQQIRQAVTNPTFNDIKITVKHPKIRIRAHPSLSHWLELDIAQIRVENEIVTHRKRLPENAKSIGMAYNECYKIELRSAVMNKVFRDKDEKITVSSQFDLVLDFERCLFCVEYEKLLRDELKAKDRFPFDDSFVINGYLGTVELKFNRQYYVEVFDVIFHNILNDDFKDYIYCFNPSLLKEELPIMRWASQDERAVPMKFNLLFDTMKLTLWDETTDLPLTRAQVVEMFLEFSASEKREKLIDIKFREVQLFKYVNVGEKEVSEVSIFNVTTSSEERSAAMTRRRKFSVEEGWNLEEIPQSSQKLEIELKKSQQSKSKNCKVEIKIDELVTAMMVELQDLRVMVHVNELLRILEFVNYVPEPLIVQDGDFEQRLIGVKELREPKSLEVIVIAKNNSICIPSPMEHCLIIQTDASITYTSRDIEQIVINSTIDPQSVELGTIGLNFKNAQVVIARQKDFIAGKSLSERDKRVLVDPFNLSFSQKTTIKRNNISNLMDVVTSSNLYVGQLAVRIGSRDFILLQQSSDWLSAELARNSSLVPFKIVDTDYKSVLTERRLKRDIYFSHWRIDQIGDKYQIILLGMQLRLINETKDYSLPLMDFTIIGDETKPSIEALSVMGDFHITADLSVFSNYFNPKISCWEPLIEKFDLNLNLALVKSPIPSWSFSLVVDKPLNCNISTEMIDSALSTIFEWKQKYEATSLQLSKGDSSPTNSRQQINIFHLENYDENLNKTTNVSPYSVRNRVGYPITVWTSESGAKFELLDGETRDIIFEKSIEELFSTQSGPNAFLHHQVFIALNDSNEHAIKSEAISIDENTSAKEVSFCCQKERKSEIYCDIQIKEKKRYITFTSSIQISNDMPMPFKLQFSSQQDESQHIKIVDPGLTISVPFDLMSQQISVLSFEKDEKLASFDCRSLIKQNQIELALLSTYCKMEIENRGKYGSITIKPLLKLKNCLPIPLNVAFSNKDTTRTQEATLSGQETVDLCGLSLHDQIYLVLSISEFAPSERMLLNISHEDNKTEKKIELKSKSGSINLYLFIPHGHPDQLFIYTKACIVNETMTPLLYFHKDHKLFPGSCEENSRGILVFDSAQEIRIQHIALDDSALSPVVSIEGIGDRSTEIMTSATGAIENFGLNITPQICERTYNLMTKVISIAPRYILINETSHRLIVIQEKAENTITTIEANERSILNFQAQSLRKFIKFKLDSQENQPKWTWSGSVDCTGAGEYLMLLFSEKYEKINFYQVSVSIGSPTVYIRIVQQPQEKTGLRVINDLDCFDLKLGQEGISEKSLFIPRKKWSPFAWIEPCNLRDVAVLHLLENKKSIYCNNYTFDRIGERILLLSNYQHEEKLLNIFMEVTLLESTRVLRVYSQKSKMPRKRFSFIASLQFETIGCSVIYSEANMRREIIYLALEKVELGVKSDKRKLETQVRVTNFEVDNNITHRTLYPCVIHPKITNKKKNPYAIDILVVSHLQKENQLPYFEKIQVYADDFVVKIEGKLIELVLRFSKLISDHQRKMTLMYNGYTDTLFFSPEEKKVLPLDGSTKFKWQLFCPENVSEGFVYIKQLIIYPISISLSFQHTTMAGSDTSLLGTYINTSFMSSIANFEDAPVTLNGIKLEGIWDKWGDVASKILSKYRSKAIEIVLGVAFSSRIIGNPVKLFGGVAQGFVDLVEKPKEAFSEGPLSGGAGIAQGIGSLSSKAIGGTFGVVQNITGSLADGISKLAVDKQYDVARDASKAKANTNIVSGMAQGFMTLGRSTVSGVTGVITKPVEGAKKGGFLGFLKGTGKGIAGLVIKPVSGTLDAVSKVSEGVSNTIDDKRVKLVRFRPIRPFYGNTKYMKQYSEEDAIGYEIISNYKGGKFVNELIWMDSFVWTVKHVKTDKESADKKKIDDLQLLVLDINRIYLISLIKYKIIMKIAVEDILETMELQNGILLKLSASTSKKMKAQEVILELKSQQMIHKASQEIRALMMIALKKEKNSDKEKALKKEKISKKKTTQLDEQIPLLSKQ